MSASPTLALDVEDLPIEAGEVVLMCDLHVPHSACGLVLFAHGSGSSRYSPRNRWVAGNLRAQRIGTLLLDLLTAEEEDTRDLRFAIELLSERLLAAVRWVTTRPALGGLPIGLFGASTGAASALHMAAHMPDKVKAVVSRGGRPDLALPYCPLVQAPTLLIVGGWDEVVIDLNRKAYEALTCLKDLVIVPGATHLFEEPGKLEEVARLTGKWFTRHLH